MKKYLFLIVCICFMFTGCTPVNSRKNDSALNDNSKAQKIISVTDSNNHTVKVKKAPQNVVALSSSFAELWMLSGGKLKGVSSNAVKERNIGIKKGDAEIVGTAMKPNLEKILALHPDLVILSKDMSSNMQMVQMLNEAGIPYYICKVETLDDYLKTLKKFVSITGEEKNYEESGVKVQKQVQKLLSLLPDSNQTAPNALVLRAFSSGVNVLSDDNTACNILNDIGVTNIAKDNSSLLKNLNIEAIIKENPDYIFVVTMGSDKNTAVASLKKSLASNPAWNNLKAVKNNNVFMLPKELFEYKPNNRWGDSYEYLLKIIYPKIYKAK